MGQVFWPNACNHVVFVAVVPDRELSCVVLGAEGQAWRRMKVATFLNHSKAIPHFQRRLRMFLDEGCGV